jgi:hypothetical protein
MKPMLEPPGTKRMKLYYDGPSSNFAFIFNSRRYTKDMVAAMRPGSVTVDLASEAGGNIETTVGRCRLTLSNPR